MGFCLFMRAHSWDTSFTCNQNFMLGSLIWWPNSVKSCKLLTQALRRCTIAQDPSLDWSLISTKQTFLVFLALSFFSSWSITSSISPSSASFSFFSACSSSSSETSFSDVFSVHKEIGSWWTLSVFSLGPSTSSPLGIQAGLPWGAKQSLYLNKVPHLQA